MTGERPMTGEPYAHGFLHRADGESALGALALTHGAGGNCRAPLLVAVAEALSANGWNVYRYDLPYRRKRASGSPHPSGAAADREGIREAVAQLRELFPGRVLAGGHSYGGRQTSMAVAEDPDLADGLLLMSYPLHPPGKPDNLRTAHWPGIRTPALFVHGARDAFGSIEELRAAIPLIPAKVSLEVIESAGHDLGRPVAKTAARIAAALAALR